MVLFLCGHHTFTSRQTAPMTLLNFIRPIVRNQQIEDTQAQETLIKNNQ